MAPVKPQISCTVDHGGQPCPWHPHTESNLIMTHTKHKWGCVICGKTKKELKNDKRLYNSQ
jgi:hypothetical protein